MNNNIDFTQTRPVETRLKTLVRAYSHKPKNKFGDHKFVFMHVGKTAGTSVNAFFQSCHNSGLRVPIVLNHNWSFQMAKLRYPRSKIVVVLRDPLERIISGFNFRLRQGGPNGHPWTTNEAIAYGHFGSVESFMDALCSDDPRHISALDFCFRHINHLRRGYRFHFGNMEKEPLSSINKIHPIRIESVDDSLIDLIDKINLKNPKTTPIVQKIYKSSVPSRSTLEKNKYKKYLKTIRSRIFLEYQSYNFLEELL